MKRIGFVMYLKPGNAVEYKRRHDEIWPELTKELESAGVCDYVIFLDPGANTLFASQKVPESNSVDRLSESNVVRKWWTYMADLMETNPDNSPKISNLEEMFYLE